MLQTSQELNICYLVNVTVDHFHFMHITEIGRADATNNMATWDEKQCWTTMTENRASHLIIN